MAAFGEVGEPVVMEVGNERIDSMAYDLRQPLAQQHRDTCDAKAVAEVPIPELTTDDRRATYAKYVTAVDCMKGKGYDVGTMVPEDTFVAKGDAFDGNLTSRWPELATDNEFNLDFIRCTGVALPPNPSK
jgi:hypothetical protein